MRKALLLIASLWLSALAAAQTGVVQNHSFLGGKKAITSGTNSTNYLDGIIPGASITVYLHNTTTKATIYTVTGGPLANPFFSNAATAVDPGGYVFRANLNVGLDVVASGGGGDAACTIQPNCYLFPVTLLVDVFPNSSISPIVNPLTIQTNEVGNTSQALLDFKDTATVKATNPSGGIESFNVPDATNSSKGVAQCDGTTTTCTAGVISANPALNIQTNEVNNTSQVLLDFQNSPTVTFRNPSAGIETADVAVSGGIGQFIQPPIAGQYVILTPTGFSKTQSGAVTVTGDFTSADLASGSYCSFPGNGTSTWTFTGALEAQYPTLNPANVTAVYAAAVGSNHGLLPVPTGCLSPSFYNTAAFTLSSTATGATGGDVFPFTSAEFESVPATAQLVSLTGANVDTTQIHGSIAMSGDFRGATDTTVTGVRLFVYYTGSPVSSPGFIPVNVPLLYSFTNGLSIDPNAAFWGIGLQARRVAELPPAASWPNAIIAVTDGTSNADCTTGFGSTPLQCRSTGTIWTPYSGGGGGGGSVGTAGQMQMVGATSGSFAPSACTDNGTTITCSEPIDVPGPPFGFSVSAGTPVAGATGTVVYASDATNGFAEVNENNGGLSRVCTALNGICSAGGSALISRVNCITYGCVADGNLAANTGTDNTTAFGSCLTAAIAANNVCYVPAGVYRIAGAMPSVTTGGTGFVGDLWGNTSSVSAGTWPAPITQIFSSSASATILTVTGGGGVIAGNSIKNIAWQRAVPPLTGAIGVLLNNTPGIEMSGNTSNDSSIGYDLTYFPNYGGSSGITNNTASFCYTTVTVGAGPEIGFNLHGGAGFQSPLFNHNGVANNCGFGITSYAYKIDGASIDLNMDSNWSALTSYGIYMTGSGGQDVQITNSTLDRCKIDCVYTSLAGNSIEIRGGWMTAADTGQTAAIELDNAAGTTIADVKFLDNQAVPVIYAHGLNDGTNAILNNRFYLDSTGAQAISANNATALNIVGNSIVGAGHTFTNPVIKFVNQDFSNIKANWLGNGAGTGISFDASSDNNCCSNLNTLITFTTSDAGTGNSFSSGSGLSGMTATQVPIAATASTVTSSKALAGSGAAITTGPSSSTNLNCAQFTGTAGELADSGAPCSGGSAFITSLTTTGSSGAATVSSGVLNVPVYTGGGSTTGGLGAPGAIGSWTWVNQGSDTAANVGTDLVLTMVNDSGLNWRLFTQNVPGSTPWEAKAYLSVGSEASPLAGSGAATDGGIYLYDGTKLLGIEFLWLGSYSTATNYPQLRVERIANVTSDNSTVYNPATTGLSGYLGFQSTGAVWVRWCDDATNLKAYYSMDGSSWTKFYTESVGTWLTPTKAGFGGVNLLTTQTQTRTLKGWTLATVASCLD